ncbi:MAG: hypothetical protein P4L40_25755 [Terracidiphilus sp.]|nr:hypothetical protein [Terracidiphilus sp.]
MCLCGAASALVVSVCVCVCVCVREREREGGREKGRDSVCLSVCLCRDMVVFLPISLFTLFRGVCVSVCVPVSWWRARSGQAQATLAQCPAAPYAAPHATALPSLT